MHKTFFMLKHIIVIEIQPGLVVTIPQARAIFEFSCIFLKLASEDTKPMLLVAPKVDSVEKFARDLQNTIGDDLDRCVIDPPPAEYLKNPLGRPWWKKDVLKLIGEKEIIIFVAESDAVQTRLKFTVHHAEMPHPSGPQTLKFLELVASL